MAICSKCSFFWFEPTEGVVCPKCGGNDKNMKYKPHIKLDAYNFQIEMDLETKEDVDQIMLELKSLRRKLPKRDKIGHLGLQQLQNSK